MHFSWSACHRKELMDLTDKTNDKCKVSMSFVTEIVYYYSVGRGQVILFSYSGFAWQKVPSISLTVPINSLIYIYKLPPFKHFLEHKFHRKNRFVSNNKTCYLVYDTNVEELINCNIILFHLIEFLCGQPRTQTWYFLCMTLVFWIEV